MYKNWDFGEFETELANWQHFFNSVMTSFNVLIDLLKILKWKWANGRSDENFDHTVKKSKSHCEAIPYLQRRRKSTNQWIFSEKLEMPKGISMIWIHLCLQKLLHLQVERTNFIISSENIEDRTREQVRFDLKAPILLYSSTEISETKLLKCLHDCHQCHYPANYFWIGEHKKCGKRKLQNSSSQKTNCLSWK